MFELSFNANFAVDDGLKEFLLIFIEISVQVGTAMNSFVTLMFRELIFWIQNSR